MRHRQADYADAEARGDDAAAATLRDLGPPAYDDTLSYPLALSSNPKWMDFDHGSDYNAAAEYPAGLAWVRSPRRST